MVCAFRVMNNSSRVVAVIFTCILLSVGSNHAAVVTSSGYTNDFSNQPAAADFATRAFGSTGTAGAGEIQTAAALDAAVQTNSTSLITAQCPSATGTPPAAASTAVWASAGGYLQTRPTQNAATLLMARLTNGTGSDGTGARILFDYVTNRAATVAEQILGYRVFYSLSGAANSWSNIVELSQTAQGTVSANIVLPSPWTNGGVLYVLWADDNGSQSPDNAQNIDNFFAEVTGTAAAATLAAPANGQKFPDTNAVTFSASANAGPGATVTGVGFYEVSGGFLGSALASPYAISANLAAGVYQAYAVATNSLGAIVFSGTNTFSVTNVPFSVALVSPANGTVHGTPTNVVFSASAYGGSNAAITGVGFFDSGSGLLASATVAPYQVNAAMGGGTYGIYAVATNTLGATVTSFTNSLVINVPPNNTNAPVIFAVNPPHSTPVTNLTSVTVTFSEPVSGVNASDLLVDGVPATGVTGTGSNYVFTFPQPAYGQPAFSWAAGHGITDFGWPTQLPFDANGEGAIWGYYLLDQTRPAIATRSPGANAVVTNLSTIDVVFTENVSGVEASDLLANGVPAFGIAGSGSNYSFSFTQPVTFGPLPIVVSWATNHGIADLATTPNTFNAANAGWTFTLDVRTVLVQSNSMWYFVKGTNEASRPTNAWRQIGFDTSGWSNAPAPFFYGDPYSNGLSAFTHLTDMQSNYSSIYLRTEFVVANASSITNVLLNLQLDDGALVWLNGVQVWRVNAPAGEVGYNGVATTQSTEPANAGSGYVSYTLTNGAAAALVNGVNVLAIHALNQSLTASSDFGVNAQLYTYVPDFSAVAPRVEQSSPPEGELLTFDSITILFTESVTGVDASDLLVNGVPAASVSDGNSTTYTFGFTQPAPGPVTVSWANGHGIVDADTPPKAFDGTHESAILEFSLVNTGAPVIASRIPAAGASVNALTSVSVTFSEPVTGVDAADFLVNGGAASSVTGSGTNYSFTFTQPAYGNVAIGWTANTGIQDSGGNAFDGSRAMNRWNYTLVDQTPPYVTSQLPIAGAFVTDLTQLTVTFSESVSGVQGSDLLLNGIPATGVSGAGATYTFTFAQPNSTVVQVSWAANHGIRDVATQPNAFDAGAAGATWSYTTTDSVAPSVAVDPPPGATVKNLTSVKVYFDEPVSGVNAGDLLVNGSPAQGLTGSGAGPYTFTFSRPGTGTVAIAFAPGHGIQDLATVPNPFGGGTWNYTLNPAIPTAIAVSHVVQMSLDGLAAVHLRFYVTNAPAQFPNFVRLMNEGAFTMNARCDYDISETVPNHTTMFTARPVLQPAGFPNTTHHGYNNNFPTASETIHNSGNLNVPYKFSMFDVAHDYGLTTAFYAGKTRLDLCDRSYNAVNGTNDLVGVDNGRDKIDFSSVIDIQGAAISNQVNTIVADLTSAAPRQYIFIHIAEPDLTGHSASWGSATWSNMVRVVDAQLGRILEAIDGNPVLANRTALIVTADHGGGGVTANAHTEAYHINNYTIPFFLRAPGITGGTDIYELFSNRADPGTNRTDYVTQPQPVRNGDGSNLALSLLALPPIPNSFMVPVFATPTVTLRVARFGGQVSLFWSDLYDEYELESAEVVNPVQWQPVVAGIATNETTRVYTVPNVNAVQKEFYRLRKK